MEGLLESDFFKTCAPQFFSEELKKILYNPINDNNKAITEFLKIIDTLVSLLSSHYVVLDPIIPDTLKDFIKITYSNMSLVFFI